MVSDHLPNGAYGVHVLFSIPYQKCIIFMNMMNVLEMSIRRCRLLQSVVRWRTVGCCRSRSSSGPGSVEETTGKEPPPQGKEVKVAVSSLRADTVAAAGLDISKKCVALSYVVCMCVVWVPRGWNLVIICVLCVY